MDGLLELGGIWLARVYAVYGVALLLIPGVLFAYVPVLAAAVWTVIWHARGQQPWPRVPAGVRRWARLALEIMVGLINPLLYLAILVPSIPALQFGSPWWLAPLMTTAWVLLTMFWMLRMFGAAVDLRSRAGRAVVQTLLVAALTCVLVFAVKDAWLLVRTNWGTTPAFWFVLLVARLSPLYLIPAVLLWDYIRSTAAPRLGAGPRSGLFLLPDRASRLAVAGMVCLAIVTLALAMHRRSDSAAQKLVRDHRESIQAAAARYDVDPRLIGSIVYVTHRDQLSPFRGALERLIISAWADNLRQQFGFRPPDQVDQIGMDENPLLNRALDVSVGLAQIKPRTAQTASVLATGRTPDELPRPAVYYYRDAEPIGAGWSLPAAARNPVTSPIPVPAARQTVANVLLDAQSNLEICALILALYRNQWEATNRDWSLRERPDVLATLYQIGFARSKPHGAPRSNAFGSRVGEVYEQPWLGELFGTTR